jgi:hypothetical protein
MPGRQDQAVVIGQWGQQGQASGRVSAGAVEGKDEPGRVSLLQGGRDIEECITHLLQSQRKLARAGQGAGRPC